MASIGSAVKLMDVLNFYLFKLAVFLYNIVNSAINYDYALKTIIKFVVKLKNLEYCFFDVLKSITRSILKSLEQSLESALPALHKELCIHSAGDNCELLSNFKLGEHGSASMHLMKKQETIEGNGLLKDIEDAESGHLCLNKSVLCLLSLTNNVRSCPYQFLTHKHLVSNKQGGFMQKADDGVNRQNANITHCIKMSLLMEHHCFILKV